MTKTCSDSTNIEIGLTTDNTVLWKRVVENQSLKNGLSAGAIVTNDFPIDPTFGDKIRITFDRANADYVQYQIVELIVLGNAAGNAKYEIKNIVVKRDNEKIDTLESGEAVIEILFPYLLNDDSTGERVLLLCGVYDKTTNKKNFGYVSEVILGQTSVVSIPCVIRSDWENSTIKAFLWDSVSGLASVSDVCEWR